VLNRRSRALAGRGDEPQGELDNRAEGLGAIERLTAGQAFHKTVRSAFYAGRVSAAASTFRP
jgi:hypothetical protein